MSKPQAKPSEPSKDTITRHQALVVTARGRHVLPARPHERHNVRIVRQAERSKLEDQRLLSRMRLNPDDVERIIWVEVRRGRPKKYRDEKPKPRKPQKPVRGHQIVTVPEGFVLSGKALFRRKKSDPA